MITAATARGLHDLESGAIEHADLDVRFAARHDRERWALVDHGRRVMSSTVPGGRWQQKARLRDAAGLVLQPLGAERCLVGTESAHLLRIDTEGVHRLLSFDDVPGREEWYNPAASGRPDVWSFAATGDAIFVSVHVGGLWRSDDLGDTWDCALAPEVDVHQVAAMGGFVVVASEGGFGWSDDLGRTWTWTTEGLHAGYLQSVTLTGDSVFVGASSGPFKPDAAVYRAVRNGTVFDRRSDGLPERFPPIGPYHLVAEGPHLAVAAWNASEVFGSRDEGRSWSRVASDLPEIRSLAAT
jgi:photosystem II stability/assembly factor-like uncharacterized protein